MKKLWNALVRKAGLLFRMVRYPEQVWEAFHDRPEFRLAALVDPDTGAVYDYPSSQVRVKTQIADALALGIDYINASGVAGDVAEFGIGSGWTSAVLARSMWADQPRRLHLFDSFIGLPEAGSVDRQSPMVQSGAWVKGTCNWNLTPEVLTRLLAREAPAQDVKIYPGWFSETFGQLPEGCSLAMVHLDCDLYQSTREVLDSLFRGRRLSEGAILLLDDWTCNRCSPDFGQQRAWRESVAEFGVRYMDYGFYSHAGKRFIYHGHSK